VRRRRPVHDADWPSSHDEVSDAFPYEFQHRPGLPTTIQLRYDSNHPADPFKQSHFMTVGEFLLVLGLGGIAATFGVFWLARADRIAENFCPTTCSVLEMTRLRLLLRFRAVAATGRL
jgi:hypothetical protein